MKSLRKIVKKNRNDWGCNETIRESIPLTGSVLEKRQAGLSFTLVDCDHRAHFQLLLMDMMDSFLNVCIHKNCDTIIIISNKYNNYYIYKIF